MDLALKCDTSKCTLPYCFCSKDGTRIPGELDPLDVSCALKIRLVSSVCALNAICHFKSISVREVGLAPFLSTFARSFRRIAVRTCKLKPLIISDTSNDTSHIQRSH